MNSHWKEFERDLRTELRRIVLAAVPYPIALVSLSAAGAVLLQRMYPAPTLVGTILGDMWWFLLGAIVVASALWQPLQRRRMDLDWYRAAAQLSELLHRKRGLASAMYGVVRNGPRRVRPVMERALSRHHEGSYPEGALQEGGCPGGITGTFRCSSSEAELQRALDREVRRYGTRVRWELTQAARVAPSVGIAVAGIFLFWILLRIVLPVLTGMLRWEMY